MRTSCSHARPARLTTRACCVESGPTVPSREEGDRLAQPSQRRSQLVRDAREECLLQAVDAEELLACSLQIAPERLDLERPADRLDRREVALAEAGRIRGQTRDRTGDAPRRRPDDEDRRHRAEDRDDDAAHRRSLTDGACALFRGLDVGMQLLQPIDPGVGHLFIELRSAFVGGGRREERTRRDREGLVRQRGVLERCLAQTDGRCIAVPRERGRERRACARDVDPVRRPLPHRPHSETRPCRSATSIPHAAR